MRILALESSCDETSAAITEGFLVHANVIASSRELFAALGGVIPEQAARRQVECVLPVVDTALKKANVHMEDIDALAVTSGPGLFGSLLVGTVTMRTLALLHKKPLIGVHHTLGHLTSAWLHTVNDPPVTPLFPVLTLSASGGHTDLWLRTSHMRGILLGRTRDDAAGEAFDKGAAQLGLPYPGGPSLMKAAATGSESAYPFPSPLHGDDSLEFSFSGLKTSLRYLLRDLGDSAVTMMHDVAASYQHAICRHLVERVVLALQAHPEVQEVHMVGGVSANTRLREMMQEAVDIPVRTPLTLAYCTDNGAMIGAAAWCMIQEQGEAAYAPFVTQASLPLAEVVS